MIHMSSLVLWQSVNTLTFSCIMCPVIHELEPFLESSYAITAISDGLFATDQLE